MPQMHPDQVEVTAGLVAALIADQHPRWAGLPIHEVAEHGTDHRLFRVGGDLVARMPVYAGSAGQAFTDARWLPLLAPHLPVALPVQAALGEPGLGYPFAWSVARWLPGRPPTPEDDIGADLADTVRALHAVPAADGPMKAEGERGAPIRGWDDAVREAVELAGDRLPDPDRVLEVWADCVAAPDWTGDPVWIHGDLLAGNLLVDDDRLSAVIDWGAVGTGDPAPDLQPYWWLPSEQREAFRDRLGYDEPTWRRGRGWTLRPALTGIPYYWQTVPAFARRGLRSVARVLADLG